MIYSKQTYQEKPTNVAPLQKPSNFIFSAAQSIDEIISIIGEGHAWRAGIYNEGTPSFKKANVVCGKMLALDFDQAEATPEQVVEYAQSVGAAPNFWYWSYSQGTKPLNNFRLVWRAAEPLAPVQYETIYGNFLTMFADFKPDAATKDISRLWYGTTKGIYKVSDEPLSLAELGWVSVSTAMEKNKPQQNIRKAVKGCEDKYLSEGTPFEQVKLDRNNPAWWERLRGRCWLWDKWEKGEYLNYYQRLVLFSNLKVLVYSNTNFSVIRDIMSFYNKEVYKNHTCDEKQIRSMLRSRITYAIPIVSTSESVKTVYEWFTQGPRIVVNKEGKITVEELDELLDKEFPVLLEQDGINYIKAQVACGKTHRIIKWLASRDLKKQKFIYAVPFYLNIGEFSRRFAEIGSPEDLHLIAEGKYSSQDYNLMELSLPPRTYQNDRIKAIQEMLNPENKGIYVITHALLAKLDACPKADVIIIDENIEDALVDKVILEEDQLLGTTSYIEDMEDKRKAIEFILTLGDKKLGDSFDLEPLKEIIKRSFNWDRYLNSNTCIKGFGRIKNFNGTAYISHRNGKNAVQFSTYSPLIHNAIKDNIPIKLLSATPKPNKLSYIYENEIPVYEFPTAQNRGAVIQFMDETGAKGTKCNKIPRLIDFVKLVLPQEIIEKSWVISFKDAAPLWEAAGFRVPVVDNKIIHLSNCAGLDFLRGEFVIVAGKYDIANEEYYDMFYEKNTDISREKPIRKFISDEINSCYCATYSWEDETLRNLQYEILEQSAVQSVGRARALREQPACVFLFNNYPIKDADLRIYGDKPITTREIYRAMYI